MSVFQQLSMRSIQFSFYTGFESWNLSPPSMTTFAYRFCIWPCFGAILMAAQPLPNLFSDLNSTVMFLSSNKRPLFFVSSCLSSLSPCFGSSILSGVRSMCCPLRAIHQPHNSTSNLQLQNFISTFSESIKRSSYFKFPLSLSSQQFSYLLFKISCFLRMSSWTCWTPIFSLVFFWLRSLIIFESNLLFSYKEMSKVSISWKTLSNSSLFLEPRTTRYSKALFWVSKSWFSQSIQNSL